MNTGNYFVNNQYTYSINEECQKYVFKRNEETLKDVDGNEIDEIKFKMLIKREVSNFINRAFNNVVVLLGAGASVTDNEFRTNENDDVIAGVTVSKIAEKIFEQLSGDFDEKKYFSLEELSFLSQYKFLSDGIVTNEIIKGTELNTDFNLEDFLSNLFAYEKFLNDDDKEKFENTKELILNTIKSATSYDYDSKKFKHVGFLNLVSKMGKADNKINIVTTNYDTLLEDAAENMNATVFDGFSFSQKPKFDSSMFDWSLTKHVSNLKTNELVYKQQVFNLLKIHGSLTWEQSQSEDSIEKKAKYDVVDPIMIFPSSNKYAQSYQVPYFDLFAKFQELLKVPNTLFITSGFSFADNHISRMILSAIKTNDGLATLITDYDINPKKPNKNWQNLIQAKDDKYQIAFLKATMNTDLTEYLGETIDENR